MESANLVDIHRVRLLMDPEIPSDVADDLSHAGIRTSDDGVEAVNVDSTMEGDLEREVVDNMEPVDQMTLRFLMNRCKYEKYFGSRAGGGNQLPTAKTDMSSSSSAAMSHEEVARICAKYDEYILETVELLLRGEEVDDELIPLRVQHLFDEFVMALVRRKREVDLEEEREEDDEEDDSSFFRSSDTIAAERREDANIVYPSNLQTMLARAREKKHANFKTKE